MKNLKIVFYLLIFILFWSCQKRNQKKKEYNIGKKENVLNICNDSIIKVYDSLFSIRSEKFNPNNIDFDESIKSDQQLNHFIDSLKVYDTCFYENNERNNFITILILKQYKFHLENYHQGYDLLSMDKNNAGYVIDKYLSILDKKKNDLEMLNSGYIVEYLNRSKNKKNRTQKSLLDDINKISEKQQVELK